MDGQINQSIRLGLFCLLCVCMSACVCVSVCPREIEGNWGCSLSITLVRYSKSFRYCINRSTTKLSVTLNFSKYNCEMLMEQSTSLYVYTNVSFHMSSAGVWQYRIRRGVAVRYPGMHLCRADIFCPIGRYSLPALSVSRSVHNERATLLGLYVQPATAYRLKSKCGSMSSRVLFFFFLLPLFIAILHNIHQSNLIIVYVRVLRILPALVMTFFPLYIYFFQLNFYDFFLCWRLTLPLLIIN